MWTSAHTARRRAGSRSLVAMITLTAPWLSNCFGGNLALRMQVNLQSFLFVCLFASSMSAYLVGVPFMLWHPEGLSFSILPGVFHYYICSVLVSLRWFEVLIYPQSG